jgi:hypothetical protein
VDPTRRSRSFVTRLASVGPTDGRSAALCGSGEEPLEEERVAAGPPEEIRANRLLQRDRGGGGLRQRVGLLVAEASELQDPPLRPPSGAPLGQLGPRQRQQQHGRGQVGVGDLRDQVQKGRLGPVEVLEHDDQRRIAGEGSEKAPDGPADRAHLDGPPVARVPEGREQAPAQQRRSGLP